MLADLKLKPVFMARDGVRLAHFEAGPANPESPPLVLVNGWTGDHGILRRRLSISPETTASSPSTFAATERAMRRSRNTP
jgi:pimeloyl-ACP methyl ester carboxylesterase